MGAVGVEGGGAPGEGFAAVIGAADGCASVAIADVSGSGAGSSRCCSSLT